MVASLFLTNSAANRLGDWVPTTVSCWSPQPARGRHTASNVVLAVCAEGGGALRRARRRRGTSQREIAQQLGVSKSRLARLESDAGPHSLEMVAQVLMASGFRLEVIDMSGAKAAGR
jgi:DNA-binding XRE family transcriptional regulator